MNGYARLEATRTASNGRWRQTTVAGAEWRLDANRGDGRRFDPLRPPRQNYGVGDRPDDFAAVRAQTQLASYFEHRVRGLIAGRALDASAGARLDAIDPGSAGGSALVSPRVLASWRVAPSLALRVAGGTTAKAPTISQRYPLPRYFDLVSFNYYPPTPPERLVMFTTRVVDTRPARLAATRASKAEAGVDWSWRGATGTATWFAERTLGAFGSTRVPVGIEVPVLRAAAFPAGAPPVLDPTPVRVDSFVGLYDAPRASRRIDTRGVELTADVPEWAAARTSLSLGGGWFSTRATDDDIEIPVEQFLSGTVQPARVGVYAGGRGSQGDRLLTTLRLIHRAPDAGLAATLIVQTTWWDSDRPLGRIDGIPVGYVDRSGTITPLTREQASSPEFVPLRRQVTPLEGRWERRPALHLVNLRLTKTLPGHSQMAVFANNAFAHLPLYQRQRQAGFERRNQPQFFGVEFLTTLGRR
ncbi:MAG TPA: TonB-dependent receptor [Gemmatimonas sp.]|nr:TonB-dependent receptor [Gemmatimonas sp.]